MQMEADASLVLQGSDTIQESLMAEAVIQVTENDAVIGPISKLDSHHQEELQKYLLLFHLIYLLVLGR